MDPQLTPPIEGNVNQGPGLIGSLVATTTTCIIVVAMRFGVRGWIVRSLGWDDWTIFAALLGTVIGTGLDFVEIHEGFGRPAYYLTKGQIREFKKYTYGEWIQTFATLTLTKISICLFLMRIPTAKILLRPLQASIFVLILTNIILTVLWIVQCRPIRGAWDPDINATCFGRGQLERVIISQAVISAVSDFLFAAFPIFILWTVQMPLKSKVALCFLMGLGVITGVCCIVRTVLNFQSIPAKDVTYDGIDNWFWRLFEVQLGIIAACIPSLRPGYKWFVGRVTTLRTSTAGWTALTGRSRTKQAGSGNSRSTPKAIVAKGSGNSTLVGTAQVELPQYCQQIRKTTDVDVERWSVKDEDEESDERSAVEFGSYLKESGEMERGLTDPVPDAK